MSNDILDMLSLNERKVLPHLNKGLKEICKSTGLKKEAAIRAIEFLSNKNIVKISFSDVEKVVLDVNGINYLKKGLPERNLLNLLAEKKNLILDEAKKISKLTANEVQAAIGALKKKAMIRIKDNKLFLEAKPEEIGLVLTGQHTVEEYEAIVTAFVNFYKTKNIFHWINNKDSFDTFDGLLLRGYKNPNTKGLLQTLDKYGITSKWTDLEDGLKTKKIKYLVVAGPENTFVYPDLQSKLQLFSQAENFIFLSSARMPALESYAGDNKISLIPLKTYIEKDGTFINAMGLAQKFKKATTVVSEALTLTEAAALITGQNINITETPAENLFIATNKRPDQVQLEHRKKNEIVFNRGRL